MIEIQIKHVEKDNSVDTLFGHDSIYIKYLPNGSKSVQGRGAGDDYASNKLMLARMCAEILRKAFPDRGDIIADPDTAEITEVVNDEKPSQEEGTEGVTEAVNEEDNQKVIEVDNTEDDKAPADFSAQLKKATAKPKPKAKPKAKPKPMSFDTKA